MLSTEDLRSLCRSEITVAALSARSGLSEREIVAARDAFLLGLSARPSRRLRAPVAIAAAALVCGVGVRALAAGTCAQTLPAPLATMCPNEPAVASELNANFGQITGWLVEKVGAVGDGGIVTTAVRSTGPIQANAISATSLTTNGNVNVGSNLIVGGSISVSGTAFGAGYQARSVNTDYSAATDGFVLVSLVGDSNGSRCFVHGLVNGIVRARESLHQFTGSDVYVNDAAFMMPVPRGSSYRVSQTNTSGSCTVSTSWIAMNQ